ncbi:MAG TPA: S-methyl-5-thioribose-1-phosphate isomerase, partial [Lachnospiraceae bacterium]|nr:S-methyl-5-thioribose-1-phosphate isomerase [Lachnospiraceae bacterium]
MNQKLDDFFEKVITVKWGPDRESVDIIDQTLLPGTIKRIQIRTQEEIWEAIKKLRVRGAPAIGVCAAYGIAVVANQFPDSDYQDFAQRFHEAKEYLASSR